MDDDRIPSVDPGAAQRRLDAERAESLVILAGEAELEATVNANAGIASRVIGWCRLPPGTIPAGYRGVWDGDLTGWTLGSPWWWRQRTVGGVGLQAQHREPLDAYQAAWERGEASRTA